jgi:hypothetical protein
MSEDNQTKDPREESVERSVFKSSGVSKQTINEFTNSAISNPAVARAPDEIKTDQVFLGQEQSRSASGVFVGEDPNHFVDGVHVGAEPPRGVDETPMDSETLAAAESLSKMDELVLKAEERKQQLETVYKETEEILEKVNELGKALEMNSELRDRITQTAARTKNLRSGFKKMGG